MNIDVEWGFGECVDFIMIEEVLSSWVDGVAQSYIPIYKLSVNFEYCFTLTNFVAEIKRRMLRYLIDN